MLARRQVEIVHLRLCEHRYLPKFISYFSGDEKLPLLLAAGHDQRRVR
jgi:hypothetical protein